MTNMGKTLLFLMLLGVKISHAQVNDNFSDGDFTNAPSWYGNLAHFTVNNAKQLQTLQTGTAQTVVKSTENYLALNVKWEFLVQLNFDPSATNQVRVYLIADKQDLNAPLNGYFVQIGENGSTDSYDLYKQSGTTVSKIIDGAAKVRSDLNKLVARIQVIRDENGRFELFTDPAGGSNFGSEGNVTDLSFTYTDWFGVWCKYTATRSDGFIFDDFSVSELSPDITPPSLLSAKAIDEFTVEAVFSERLDPSLAMVAGNYKLNLIGNPVTVTSTGLPTVYHLHYTSALPTGDYELAVSGIADRKGNLIGSRHTAGFFYLKPYLLKKGDLLISEVLFNPRNGGADFVEIYNNTNQILDVAALQLANADVSGAAANIKNVSSIAVYLQPKSYWVLTTNAALLAEHYKVCYAKQVIQMSSLPAFNNDKGSVILIAAGEILERFDYSEKMHHALLRDLNGVSLERVSFSRPANDGGNFSSAASSIGFASPTGVNSQSQDPSIVENNVSLLSKTFSPDGDGFEDVLCVDYLFAHTGNFVNVTIYSDRGVLIRKLERNTTIGVAGRFSWDGLNDAGVMSKVGIYVLKFDVFALDGRVGSYRKVFVLAAKLD